MAQNYELAHTVRRRLDRVHSKTALYYLNGFNDRPLFFTVSVH